MMKSPVSSVLDPTGILHLVIIKDANSERTQKQSEANVMSMGKE